MSATNLDLPVLISAEQIRRREFVTIRRGYDPDQVRAYLGQLADQVELMRILLRDAQAEAETSRRAPSQPRQDPYQLLGERVASVIREADHVAETITSEAHRNADDLTREARADADRIRTDAQAKAEEARSRAEHAVRTAREEADRTIAGLSTRRDALVDQIASMQERLIGVARDLESAMDVQFTIPDIPAVRDLLDEPAEETPADEKGTSSAVAPSGDAGGDAADPIEVEAASAVREPAIAVAEAGDEESGVLDPFYEELWEGTGAMQLDIPALDLDWGDMDEEGDDPPPYS
jgi:DivIVA domain-containing protein